MIVSASYRTDIPAFYGAWFQRRLEAGFCTVRNPYGKPYTVRLDPELVSGFVFWTRNAAPFLPVLDRLAADGIPFVVHYTITAYPRLLETSVIDAERAARQVHAIARDFGPRAAVWRCDPIVVTGATPLSSHAERFARLAETLAGAVDEAVLSFASFYRKTRRNLAAAGRNSGLTWEDPAVEQKRAVVAELAATAREFGMQATICAQPDLAAGGAREALSPYAVAGEHEASGPLSAAEVELIHRLTTDPGRLRRSWAEGILAAGVSEEVYVEIVAIVCMVMIVDTFRRALGLPQFELPAPVAGTQSGYRAPGAQRHDAWISLVQPDDVVDSDGNLYGAAASPVVKALSLVPEAKRAYWDLAEEHYLPGSEMTDYATGVRAIDRMQMELIAGRVSALHQCVY